jgi:hypothetical protein
MPKTTKFAVADSVRVKSGVMDPDYRDIPLGGWRGTISQVWEVTPPLYLIQWDGETLENIPPIYRKRCQRDGFVLEEIWLSEEELEADLGGPVLMEQPPGVEDSLRARASSGASTAPDRRPGDLGGACWEEELLTLSPDQPATVIQEPPEFPAGTVAFYGPDDKTTTKIVAGVILAADAEPIFRRWSVVDFDADLRLQREMQEFFREHEVKSVTIDSGNTGCPHEEGKDFPVGGDCPFCPWWRGKRSRAQA